MGLDMYLRKFQKVDGVDLYKLDPDELKEHDSSLYERLKKYEIKQGDPKYFTWQAYYEKVGYWRKANQIHSWFVNNVQGGEDECNPYIVSKEQLQSLLETCKLVFQSQNVKVAEELLETQGGFFFGSTEYDEYYWKDLENTINILTKVLSETNFDTEYIVYQSSW